MYRRDKTRRYWKADGTFEIKPLDTVLHDGDIYQWRDGTWRHKVSAGNYATIHPDNLPAPIQMALLLLGE